MIPLPIRSDFMMMKLRPYLLPTRLMGWWPLLLGVLFFLFSSCEGGGKENGEGNGKGQDTAQVESPRDSLEERLRTLNKKVRSDPQDGQLYYKRADVKRRIGQLSDALDDMERALRIDSTVSKFHKRKADLHFQAKSVEDAIHHYRKAIALDGDNTDALVGLADLYYATRDHQKAMNYANEALRVDQHLSRPYTIKGLIYEREGDTARAISSLQTAAEMETDNFPVYLQLGYLTGALDREIAVDYYNTAHRLKPKDPRPLYNKGLYLQEHARPEEAIQAYKELIEVDTGYVEAYFNIGYIHLVHNDDPRGALKWYNKVLNFTPNYPQAIHNKGLCYEKLGKTDSARAAYKRALDLKGDYRPSALGLNRLEAQNS